MGHLSCGAGVMLRAGTAVSASGTAVDFLGIPAWAKRVTVSIVGLSTTGVSALMMRAGTAAGFAAAGYTAGSDQTEDSGLGFIYGTLFPLLGASAIANILYHGALTLTRVSGNTWAMQGNLTRSDNGMQNVISGSVALAGELDRLRISTISGTDSFDAGTINLLYE